ncbi:hypothetical protein C9374_007277 [Naegleria lovaniensis]|uniref:Uncharacterized protein n=1 Tax=Naegleria lovaniensis TaxID=51637 RepID=A0AA88H761_NAELO|nr:uncharacterized protein C9374_007277 [Naegleria lovaniensis]KAG2393746.1 hypothetical protein C9374_007277 [Naegleria lovaniensis]
MFGSPGRSTTINNNPDTATDITLLNLGDCLKKQWEIHNRSVRTSSNDDDELHEETEVDDPSFLTPIRECNVDDQYDNDSALVKRWIISDQQEGKKKHLFNDGDCTTSNTSQQHDTLANLLELIRQHLDDNSKYDILEYIPTYSKWAVFQQEGSYQKYLRAIKYPFHDASQKTLPHHLEYHLDIPFVTFHKMRLICKRFNTRMMRRILQTTELCLFSLDEHTLPYIATFLRVQRLFKENKDRLATEVICLYDDRQHLHMETSVGHVASHNLFGASPCNQLQLKDRNFCSNLTHSLKTGSVNTFCFGSSESATDVAATMVPSSPIMNISKNEKDEHQNSNASQQPTFGFSFGESVPTGSSSVDQPTTFDQTTTTSATFSFSFGSTNENDQEKDMNQQYRTLSDDENEYSTTKAPTTSENDSGVNISSTASVFHGLSNSTINAAANGVDSVSASNTNAHISHDCMKSKYEMKAKIGFGFWNESTGKSSYVPCVEETINHYAESSIEESVCSLFIGDNTTLQSLIIHTPSSEAFSITSILSCLKALKHVVIWTANANVNFTHECVKKVVLVNSKCKADLVNYLPNVEKIVLYSCSMDDTVTPFSFGIASTVTLQGEAFETTNGSGITELLQEFDPRIAMKIIEKTTKNQKGVGYSFNGSSQLLLKDILKLASDVDIEKAKQFISYVIKDLRVPCQDLNLCELSFNSLTDQCIAQYIVYLCNEYQGGRLLRVPGLHDRGSEEFLLLLLSYGWNCWKQKDELIYMMCSWITKHHYILEFLLRNFYNNWDVDALYSLMVHCCRRKRIRALDAILSYCLVNKEEVLMKALTMPVKCLHIPSTWEMRAASVDTCTTPLLGLVIQYCAQSYGGFLMQRIIERMSQEQFDSLGANENGDNILHLFAFAVNSTKMSGSLLLTLIRKAPHLLRAENSKKQTPLMMIQLPESFLERCIEQELGIEGPLEWNRETLEVSSTMSCQIETTTTNNNRRVLKARRSKK